VEKDSLNRWLRLLQEGAGIQNSHLPAPGNSHSVSQTTGSSSQLPTYNYFCPVKNIAIFASGDGSNAQKIIDHFRNSPKARVSLIVSNNPGAYVLERARKEGIPALIIGKASFSATSEVVERLRESGIDLIVLAGFLWLIPQNLIEAYPDRIINIHPALLPGFGGKGMYGMNVHRAVRESGVKETGITVHFVNEHYDSGEIILQERCLLNEEDTPESISAKVRELEHRYFPLAVEKVVDQLNQ
jgi:phosphoribosylglycinamide formyltransferase 1